MFISKVKPDLKSILYFFDNQHNFFTKIDIHFTHNDQKLKAVLIWPFRKNVFMPDRIEVFSDGEWVPKKGEHLKHMYAEALSENRQVNEVHKKIKASEKAAKLQLERKFVDIVKQVAKKVEGNLNQHAPTECKVSNDNLTIVVTTRIGDVEETGQIETNNYVHNQTIVAEVVESFSEAYTANILQTIEQRKLVHAANNKPEKVYITTIPVDNPLPGKTMDHQILYASVRCESHCSKCNQTVVENIDTNRQIHLDKLSDYKGEFIVKIVGDRIVCPTCKMVTKKDRVIMTNKMTGQVLAQRYISELTVLGTMDQQEEMENKLRAVLYDYNKEMEEFWQAYSFVAAQNWDLYVKELTEKELELGLVDYIESVPSVKADLLLELKRLSLDNEERKEFWQKANKNIVQYYSDITVFGWNIKEAIRIIGPNRAEFIFRNICMSPVLEDFRKMQIAKHFIKTNHDANKLQDTVVNQQQQIHELRQENGRLSHKLGEAYSLISQLEKGQQSSAAQERSKNDILKIQQLKGLIEELKTEISELSSQLPQEEHVTEVALTEEQEEQVILSPAEMLKGKHILILGGYRNKQIKSEQNYTISTHSTRIIDPLFYDALKQADIIVILTRYISHRAMWEAKEFAILEEKPVYYSTFTNVPAILGEVAGKIGGVVL